MGDCNFFGDKRYIISFKNLTGFSFMLGNEDDKQRDLTNKLLISTSGEIQQTTNGSFKWSSLVPFQQFSQY